MPFLKFIAIFSFSGLLIPILIRIIWNLIDKSKSIDLSIIFQKVTLLLWPTFLMVLPSSQEPGVETKFFLLSLAANVAFYTIIGVVFWLGLRKHAVYFFIGGIPLALMWWWFLNL